MVMAGNILGQAGFDTGFFAGEGMNISVRQDFETRHWDLYILYYFCSVCVLMIMYLFAFHSWHNYVAMILS